MKISIKFEFELKLARRKFLASYLKLETLVKCEIVVSGIVEQGWKEGEKKKTLKTGKTKRAILV
jgi:hypothetical protein